MSHGGPAFPRSAGDYTGTKHGNIAQGGMTTLDYFMAHAPAEPQPWFKPVTEPAPPPVDYINDMTPEEWKEYEGWGEFLDTKDLKCSRVRAYAESSDAYTGLRRKWEAEYEKQRYVQWPKAWAMEMIAERAK
jgi:hypothetical protein